MRFIFFSILLIWFFLPTYPQVGGEDTYDFLNLNTSPRVLALGGYLTSILDNDINHGIYNPALIHLDMSNTVVLNYTNYFADINYGDAGYCFHVNNQPLLGSMKFINYGEFTETNEFGQEIGKFNASEYLFSIGMSKSLIDSSMFLGVSTKLVYSSFYELNSIGLLVDVGSQYNIPNKNISLSLIIKNLGYQLKPYYNDNRESMPFEIIFGISNQLAHMPLKWHLTFQHIERFDLGYDNTSSMVTENNFGYKLLQHVVFGGELFVHRNATLLFGYNNRKRTEMIISDRKGLVGFSCGISFRVKRFKFNYSRTSSHISGPVNSFGIVTNFKKIE